MTKVVPEFFTKKWGYEKTIINNDKYCGKLLFMIKGTQTSWHYYKNKDKTYYVRSGKVRIEHSVQDMENYASFEYLEEGDAFHVEPGIRHRVKAMFDSEMYEFSTPHEDEDAVKLAGGGFSPRE